MLDHHVLFTLFSPDATLFSLSLPCPLPPCAASPRAELKLRGCCRTSRLGGTEGEDEESNSDSSSESVSSDEEEAEWHNARDHFSQTPFLGFEDDLHAHHEVEARLDKRLKKNDCCMVLVTPDNQSIYMALTEVGTAQPRIDLESPRRWAGWLTPF